MSNQVQEYLSSAGRELHRIYKLATLQEKRPKHKDQDFAARSTKDYAVHGLNHLERARLELGLAPLRLEDDQTWDLRQGFVRKGG
jgi:hypothetical protein